MADYPIIDADGHVNEPEEMWPKYLEPQYHSMAPRSVLDNQGRRRRLVAGELHPYIPAPPERSQERRTDGGFNPLARLADMDSEGMDVAVIYPSTGLHFGSIERLDVLSALCRAYNNWLYDYCSAASDRLIGIASALSFNLWSDFTPLAMFSLFEHETFFGLIEYLTANIMTPTSVLLIAIFGGWIMSAGSAREELGLDDGTLFRAWRFCIRYVAPIAVATIFVVNLV